MHVRSCAYIPHSTPVPGVRDLQNTCCFAWTFPSFHRCRAKPLVARMTMKAAEIFRDRERAGNVFCRRHGTNTLWYPGLIGRYRGLLPAARHEPGALSPSARHEPGALSPFPRVHVRSCAYIPHSTPVPGVRDLQNTCCFAWTFPSFHRCRAKPLVARMTMKAAEIFRDRERAGNVFDREAINVKPIVIENRFRHRHPFRVRVQFEARTRDSQGGGSNDRRSYRVHLARPFSFPLPPETTRCFCPPCLKKPNSDQR